MKCSRLTVWTYSLTGGYHGTSDAVFILYSTSARSCYKIVPRSGELTVFKSRNGEVLLAVLLADSMTSTVLVAPSPLQVLPAHGLNYDRREGRPQCWTNA